MADATPTADTEVNPPRDTPPASQEQLDFSTPQTVVTIIVDQGVNQQTFVIHKHLVSHHSPFFKAEFDSSIEENEIKSITMENVEARIFGLFVHWLYTQTKRMSQLQSRPLIDWAKFYSLAIRFKVSKLSGPLFNEVKYTEPSDDPHSGNTLRDFQHFAYSTQGNFGLRELAVEKTMQVFATSKLKGMDEFVAAFPDGMLVDFMKEMAQT